MNDSSSHTDSTDHLQFFCKTEDQSNIYSAAKAVLAVLKGAPEFAFPAGTSAQGADTSSSKCPTEQLVQADFHGEAGGEMHSCPAAAPPPAPAENTAAALVPQELQTSTLYLLTLSKKFALMVRWQQLAKIQFMCMYVHKSKIIVYYSVFSLIPFLPNSVNVGQRDIKRTWQDDQYATPLLLGVQLSTISDNEPSQRLWQNMCLHCRTSRDSEAINPSCIPRHQQLGKSSDKEPIQLCIIKLQLIVVGMDKSLLIRNAIKETLRCGIKACIENRIQFMLLLEILNSISSHHLLFYLAWALSTIKRSFFHQGFYEGVNK